MVRSIGEGGIEVRKAEVTPLEGFEACVNCCGSVFMMASLAGYCAAQARNIIRPRTIRIFKAFDKVIGTAEDPGWYFYCLPFGVEHEDVSTAIETQQVLDCNVPDATGAPIVASAVFNYYITDAIQATYGVDNLAEFLQVNAQEVVKSVCQLFPMRSNDETKPSLMGDTALIGAAMAELMNKRAKATGVRVIRMELMEVSYASEVATSMLQVQQAQAKIDARQLTVAGSVAIAAGGIQKLKDHGLKLPKNDEEDLSSKLMLIACSE